MSTDASNHDPADQYQAITSNFGRTVYDVAEIERSFGCTTPSRPGSHKILHENDPTRQSKNINVTKQPDRAQVTSRLEQIQDYIAQTSTLMNALKISGDPCQQAQYHKLLMMVSDLRDSELKLQIIVSGLDDASDLEEGEDDTENQSAPRCTSVAINGHQTLLSNIQEDENTNRQNNPLELELLAKLQKQKIKLHDLQKQATAQLLEAKLKQEKLLVESGSLSELNPLSSSSADGCKLTEAQELLNMHSSLSTEYNPPEASISADGQPPKLDAQLHNLQGRLSNLHEMYDSQRELVDILGERDDELSSEYQKVQNRLDDIQKKRHLMNKMMEDAANASNSRVNYLDDDEDYSGSTFDDYSADTLKNFNADDSADPATKLETAQRVNQYFQMMLMSTNQEAESEGTHMPAANVMDQAENNAELVHHFEVAKKQDNISVAPDLDRNCHIPKKVNEENPSRAKKLAHIKEMLTYVTSQYHQGIPIGGDVINEILLASQGRSSTEGSTDGMDIPTQFRFPTEVVSGSNLQAGANQTGAEDLPLRSVEEIREMTRAMEKQTMTMRAQAAHLSKVREEVLKLKGDLPLHKKKTNTQALSQQMLSELQARKGEFEGLMRKDKGRASAANQDNCVEASPDKSETAGYSGPGCDGSNLPMWADLPRPVGEELAPPFGVFMEASQNQDSSDEENAPMTRSNIPSPLIRNNRELPRRFVDAMSNHSAQSLPPSCTLPVRSQPWLAARSEARRNEWPGRQPNVIPGNPNRPGLTNPSINDLSNEWLSTRINKLEKENARLRYENNELFYHNERFPAPSLNSAQFNGGPGMRPSHSMPQNERYCLRTMSEAIDQCSQLIVQQHDEVASLRDIIGGIMSQMARNDRVLTYLYRQICDMVLVVPPNIFESNHAPRLSNLYRNQSQPPPSNQPPQPPEKLVYSNGPPVSQIPDMTAAQSLPNLPRDVEGGNTQASGMNASHAAHTAYPRMFYNEEHLAPLPPHYIANNQTVPDLRFQTWGHGMTAQGPTPALNNQVPPGNRTNNYLDNFRR